MRRTKEDAEKTRLKIIEAALILFSRNGYSNTTLAMIGTEAGYSRGPIYWHFKNKEDLFQAVLAYSQEPLEQLVAQARNGELLPLATIERFVTRWFDLLVEDAWFRQSFEILLNKTEMTEAVSATLKRERKLTRSMISTLQELLLAAQEEGAIPQAQPAEQLALMVYTQLMGITQSWLFAPRLFSLSKQRGFFAERLLVALQQP
ncbi:TetR family transcriptional regulator [Pseudomonas sp. 5Ae-yellow]|uniref:TetR family transcriptional regulator n=1 Tax=Pseudomonas sp. 5Ae-yellow TaxID=2759848 RepID=UPI0015F58F02|nr:TetR family transcriptional regulator [Pseudomonas sp. 5Ae-yellow]MBA6420754.1 TetR family transcriptional regulator [Pseudomonas sp. 5Ae-yellow]|tara:strand:- start:4 stop:615 length:612 start_codon:yes stop_codon:yes gene_type:complete